MLRMLEAQAPAKQTVTDTINTLCSRLANASLLEDRRAAILGLRSFAKTYPASVASGALRGLISSLTKDQEDVDTSKVILETLLMLFNPEETSPEASDDIALWLADEFTQRQDNITTLLDLLDTSDFYCRLYALQLITSITSARPERTQECILSAPLGTTRLVSTLDDSRDAIRNAGIVLLSDLTQANPELQKLVAFENAFDRIFALIEAEGSLQQGGIVVQDCLSLLANLIRHNASNQNLFRETGCILKLTALLPGGPQPAPVPEGEDDDWVSPQKDKNIWGLLAVLRMFLTKGSMGTLQNQNAFQKHGLLQQVLNLAFDDTTLIPLKAESLNTCADIIRGNPRLQEGFAQMQVKTADKAERATNGDKIPNGVPRAFVIDALLDLTLSPASTQMFEARIAACECIKAYCFNHAQIQSHFLHRAIDGHKSGEDATANVLSTLINGPQSFDVVDPYRCWFASVLVLHLIYDNPEAKSILIAVSEGDAEQGEEVVTCIQLLAGNLISGLQRGEDERILIAYLMLLTSWLYEDAPAVNDFLGEGSAVQSLVQAVSRPGTDLEVVKGLCAILLGILYEFSTKDSPIPRRTLQPVLTSSLGRERYLEAITQLRQHPLIRDFEVLPQGTGGGPGSLPDAFFDATFVEFLKDNFSRLSRAIDRDPAFEVFKTQEGVDRDLVDTLRTQLGEKAKAIEKLESDLVTMERRLNQEQADNKRNHEISITEINKFKSLNESLQRGHEADVQKLEAAQQAALRSREEQHKQQLETLSMQHQRAQREEGARGDGIKQQHQKEVADLHEARTKVEGQLKQAREMHVMAENRVTELEDAAQKSSGESESLKTQKADLEEQLRQSKTKVDKLISTQTQLSEGTRRITNEIKLLNDKFKDREARLKASESKLSEAQKEVDAKEEARSQAQTELEDMLMVLADLEEKRTRDKKRLKQLGEEVTDVEDEDEDGDEDEGEEEEEDGGEEEADAAEDQGGDDDQADESETANGAKSSGADGKDLVKGDDDEADDGAESDDVD